MSYRPSGIHYAPPPGGRDAPPSGIISSRVKRRSSESRVRVCLLWHHPLVLIEVRRVLSDQQFEILPLKIESSASSMRDGLLPSETLLHLIDSEALGAQTAALVGDLVTVNPSARPIVMADDLGEATAFSLLRLGTKGIVTYAEVTEHLPRILGEVNAGGFWVPRAVLSRFVDAMRVESAPHRPVAGTLALTPREQDILDDLLQNLSNKEIAHKRHISSRTAKFHVSNVLSKHGVRRRADLFLLTFPERGASQPT